MPSRLVVVAGVLFVAGCGSSGNQTTPQKPARGTLQALAQGQGQTVAITPGDADFAPGPIRYTFLVIARNGRAVARPTATVWLARALKAKPFQHATARLESIGVPGASAPLDDVQSLYVVHLDVPAPGTYWVLAQPRGAHIRALGNVVVRERTASPAIGSAAPRSRTPTLASTGGDLEALTTSTHPDRALYRWSIAQALAAHAPSVVVFATPKFCASRTCGPVVDVVSAVRRTFPHVRFIHVEVYAGNDPTQGYNRWMKDWHLMSEPWVFLVGRDGRIKAKFEGSVSVRELRRAIQNTLMG